MDRNNFRRALILNEKIVALLAEGVDRNTRNQSCTSWLHVALLAEGVDRNDKAALESVLLEVALLAEGVDRN